jgi:hypothetical protein
MESLEASTRFLFKVPILALCIHKHPGGMRVIVGEGPKISIYDLSSKNIIHYNVLFAEHFKITDISTSGESILV